MARRSRPLGINWHAYAAEDWDNVRGVPEIKIAKSNTGKYAELELHAIVDGRRVGELSASSHPEGRYVHIDSIAVGPKKTGLGTKLYEVAARWACSLGKPLASDEKRSAMADSFWKKQVRKKRAKCDWRLKGAEARNVREEESITQPEVSLFARGGCVRYVLRCPSPRSLAGPRRRR